jgi:uncharacterized Zn-binding protein involved in type VI secretion
MLFAIAVCLMFSIDVRAQQAAGRQGDATSHGGVIVGGLPTVLINGRPVARVGDFVSCPQVTGTVPHVGGPISTGSSTVLIGGLPAARAGDQNIETGASSVIVGGSSTVLIGG